jgi:energy-coupling factor transport system permease protein
VAPTFELYVETDSWLHRLDPRTKLAFVVLSAAGLLSLGSTTAMAVALTAIHFLLLSARVPLARLRWVWRRLWPLNAMIVALWPLFAPGGAPVLAALGPVRVTWPGLVQGLTVALRLDALAFAGLVLLLTTGQAELVRGLVRLGLPFEWGLTLALGLRYAPTVYELYETVLRAQQARGWTPEARSLIDRWRAYGPVLVATIINTLRMSDQLAVALAARGLGAGRERTSLKDVHFGPADWAALAATGALFAALMLLEK